VIVARDGLWGKRKEEGKGGRKRRACLRVVGLVQRWYFEMTPGKLHLVATAIEVKTKDMIVFVEAWRENGYTSLLTTLHY